MVEEHQKGLLIEPLSCGFARIVLGKSTYSEISVRAQSHFASFRFGIGFAKPHGRAVRGGFHQSFLFIDVPGLSELLSGRINIHFAEPETFWTTYYAARGINHPALFGASSIDAF